jgi:hypothetical protein
MIKFIKVSILAGVVASGIFGTSVVNISKVDNKQVAVSKPVLPEPDEPFCEYPTQG